MLEHSTTGRQLAYDSEGNTTQSRESLQPNKTIGYSSPQTSCTGQLDWTLSSTSLLTIRGRRFWGNYKTIGIPNNTAIQYGTSSVGLDGIPADLQQPVNFQFSPRLKQTFYGITARTYVQAGYSHFARSAPRA